MNHGGDKGLMNNKHAKKVAAIEESIQASSRNMTISEDFMKWCHEQLRDFDAGCKCFSSFCSNSKFKFFQFFRK